MRTGDIHHGAITHGWVRHNMGWLAILALLLSVFERPPAGEAEMDGEDG